MVAVRSAMRASRRSIGFVGSSVRTGLAIMRSLSFPARRLMVHRSVPRQASACQPEVCSLGSRGVKVRKGTPKRDAEHVRVLTKLHIRAKAGSRKTGLSRNGDTVVLRVSARAIEGAANEAV